MNIYNSIPAARLKRSMFHWKTERNQTQDFGAIVPFFRREVLPGDVWKLNLSAFIRVQPMVAAPFTPMRFYAQFWFFPTRVLMQKLYPEIGDAWETFIFGGPTGNGQNEAGQTPTLPIWIPNAKNVKLAGIDVKNGVQSRKTGNADAKGSLWDYFGHPVNQGYNALDNNGLNTNNVDYSAWCPLAFDKIAYNFWWNTFMRNENLEQSVDLMSDDVQLCAWKHDYFNSALPFQQRGDPVALPLGEVLFNDLPADVNPLQLYAYNMQASAPDKLSRVDKNLNPIGYGAGANEFNNYTGFGKVAETHTAYQGDFVTRGVGVNNSKNSLDKDFSITYVDPVPGHRYPAYTQANVDVSDMRLMFQTQKFMERAARGGVRYIEGLKAFFGTSPRNDVLQLPVFIGGMKQNIIVNEVLQTSETSTTPQGNIAGRGISAGADNIGVLSAKEHGYIMGFCWIKPDLYYMNQGVHRECLRRSKFDFYWPQFAHLSERSIYKAEIFASPATMTPAQLGAGVEGILGYTGMYNEYRSSHNEICGEMRDTFKYWHLAREFSSAPELGADLIRCFPRKDIFAVQDEDEFMLDILTDVKVWRPMPIESDPGLLDHF